MAVIINGTTGITDVNGTAAAPAITGTDTDTGVFFGTNTVSLSTNGTERLQVDASGNLGLGVTPSAWRTAYSQKAIQVGPVGFISSLSASSSNNQTFVGSNFYTNTSSQNIYINSDYATQYAQFAGQHSWSVAASGTAGATFSFTQAMTLDASGNLGIGITSPTPRSGGGGGVIDANGPLVARGAIAQNQTNAAVIQYDSNNMSIRSYGATTNSGYITFLTGGGGTSDTERARITSSGTWLVGRTAASDSTLGFQVDSAGRVNAAISTDNSYLLYSTAASAYRFYVTNGGQINATSTSITAISDQSLKENIRDIDTGLSQVLALRPRRFDWKEETAIGEKDVAGFIAQEVEEVLPELVYEYQYSEGVTKKSLKMGDILPTLVKAIQEQQAIITQLQADVAALKGNA